jgi:hypothetical protein
MVMVIMVVMIVIFMMMVLFMGMVVVRVLVIMLVIMIMFFMMLIFVLVFVLVFMFMSFLSVRVAMLMLMVMVIEFMLVAMGLVLVPGMVVLVAMVMFVFMLVSMIVLVLVVMAVAVSMIVIVLSVMMVFVAVVVAAGGQSFLLVVVVAAADLDVWVRLLDLDGRVEDLVLFPQDLRCLVEGDLGLGGPQVPAHGEFACGERPDVEVVDLLDLLDAEHVLEAGQHIHFLGRGLHQNTHTVAEDGDRGEDADHCEDYSADRVGNMCLGEEVDNKSRYHNSYALDDVTDDMDNSGA